MAENNSIAISFDYIEALARSMVQSRNRSQPIKITFISHQHHYWNSFSSIIRAMQAKPERFNVAALLVPFAGKQRCYFKDYRLPLETLREQGFPVFTPEQYNIHKELPQLAFFSNPYTVQRENKYIPEMLLVHDTLSVLIPYCTEFMGTDDFISLYFTCYKSYWRAFTSSSMSAKIYTVQRQAPKWNVPVMGNPEYDVVLNAAPESLKKYQLIKKLAAGRKIVLWTPHYKLEPGWGTLKIFGQKTALLFKKYADELFIVMRPHQILTGIIRQYRDGTETNKDKDVDEIARLALSSENFWLDDDDLAIESVYAADALVSDMSSILTKAMALGKSVLYTYGKTGSGAGKAEPVLTRYIHNASRVSEIEDFLLMVKNGEQDPLLPLPQNVKNAFCGPVDGKAGQRIADYIEDYFFPAE